MRCSEDGSETEGGEGTIKKFKYMPAVPLSYEAQGLIYFTCRDYKQQPEAVRSRVRRVCAECADGDPAKERAIFTFVTTRISWRECCDRHYISDATLDRLRRRFYSLWGER